MIARMHTLAVGGAGCGVGRGDCVDLSGWRRRKRPRRRSRGGGGGYWTFDRVRGVAERPVGWGASSREAPSQGDHPLRSE